MPFGRRPTATVLHDVAEWPVHGQWPGQGSGPRGCTMWFACKSLAGACTFAPLCAMRPLRSSWATVWLATYCSQTCSTAHLRPFSSPNWNSNEDSADDDIRAADASPATPGRAGPDTGGGGSGRHVPAPQAHPRQPQLARGQIRGWGRGRHTSGASPATSARARGRTRSLSRKIYLGCNFERACNLFHLHNTERRPSAPRAGSSILKKKTLLHG